MSLPTALVRNFLSACKPWAPSEISRMYIESGVLSTLGLGSFFSFYEAIHDLSSGLKNFHRFSIISRNIDRLSLNISGSEICIVRHGVGRKIWDSQLEIMFGIVKLIFGVGFAYMTIAVRGGYFSNNIYVIHTALGVLMFVFPFFLWCIVTNLKHSVAGPRRLLQFAKHIGEVIAEREDSTSLVQRAFDCGFGDASGLFDIVALLDSGHVAAWSNSNSNNSATAAQAELDAVQALLAAVSAESTNRSPSESHRMLRHAQVTAIHQADVADSCTGLLTTYLILDTMAWYGYSLVVLLYFVTESEAGAGAGCWCNSLRAALKLGLSDDQAIFLASQLADIAWTIEAALQLDFLYCRSLFFSAPPSPIRQQLAQSDREVEDSNSRDQSTDGLEAESRVTRKSSTPLKRRPASSTVSSPATSPVRRALRSKSPAANRNNSPPTLRASSRGRGRY